MTDVVEAPASERQAGEPFPRPGALPYLTVRGAQQAIDFYVEVFDALVVGEPITMPDGRIGHCELSLSDGVIYLAEEFPDVGLRAPAPGAVSVSLMVPVDNADATLSKARTAGATVEREPQDSYGRRGAVFLDPFGHRWMLSAPLTSGLVVDRIRQGDIGYVSWWTPDAERAERFYRIVLGWGPLEHGQVNNLTRQVGIDGDHETSTLFCCYAVDDIDATVEAVRTAGGTADDPAQNLFGPLAQCVTPQGEAFAVYQPKADDPRPPINGTLPGDLSYITFRTQGPSAPTREFYSSVLGWTFSAGRVEDGWEPEGVHPMSGLAGGGDGTTVPMWTTPDVAAAVERVRAAGGTVLDGPTQQPYGITAECLDDQGGHFYLGTV